MLPKTRRLARKDFLLAKAKGKSYSLPHFSAIVYSRPQNTTPPPPPKLGGGERSSGVVHSRFAIVTSAKLHKHAVVRNRLRRRLYDCVKNFPGSQDIIIFPKPSIFTASDSEIFQALLNISPLASPSYPKGEAQLRFKRGIRGGVIQ